MTMGYKDIEQSKTPSARGSRLYTPGLLRFVLTNGAETKVFRAKEVPAVTTALNKSNCGGKVGAQGEADGPVVAVNLSPEVGVGKWGMGGARTALPEELLGAVTATAALAQAGVTGFAVMTAGGDKARVIKAPEQVWHGSLVNSTLLNSVSPILATSIPVVKDGSVFCHPPLSS